LLRLASRFVVGHSPIKVIIKKLHLHTIKKNTALGFLLALHACCCLGRRPRRLLRGARTLSTRTRARHRTRAPRQRRVLHQLHDALARLQLAELTHARISHNTRRNRLCATHLGGSAL
jgi:hypothetical protein